MKFRWKLMIITMLIVSFSFGFGGMLLIQYSYQASIKQEKRAATLLFFFCIPMVALKGE